MNAQRENWQRFVAKSLMLSVVVMVAAFVGNKLANAGPGVAGGAARTSVTVAGTLTGTNTPTGMPTSTNAIFHFVRADGGTELCTIAPTATVHPDATTGAFSVEVPIDNCPGVFDGSDVTVSVELHDGADAGLLTTDASTINPVPYAHYASVAGHYGTPDCPVGYMRDVGTAGIVLCQKIRMSGTTPVVYDEVVRVGTGATAFWIDRYEASIWQSVVGLDETPLFRADGDFPVTFPRNGQMTAPLYALSRSGTTPARWITWFQANEACRASGKRLPTAEEWLTAARGTPDPLSASDGSGGRCLTQDGGPSPGRLTGNGTACVSAWGAQDMIGNVAEWTAEWYAGAGSALEVPSRTIGDAGEVPAIHAQFVNSPSVENWPSDYNGDGTTNVATQVTRDTVSVTGLPAAALRGGGYNSGPRAGVFALFLGYAPSARDSTVGFRCVIPR